MNKNISAVAIVSIAFVAVLFSLNASPAHAATSTPINLIANPDMQISTLLAGVPDGWLTGNFGTNTVAFAYPLAGPHVGDKAAQTLISSYASGDAKWYFTPVAVTGGATYAFSDWYNSTSTTYLTAQITSASGTFSYDVLATLPPTSGWVQSSESFTVPANATAVTVFHLIQNVGSLATTDYSLTQSAPASQNLFPEGMVSLTFDDGWASQYANALPMLQAANMNGTFYIISQATRNAVETIFPSGDNPTSSVSVATTSRSITWGNIRTGDAIYGDPTQNSYYFNDSYTATATSTVTASYSITDAATGDIVYATGTIALGTLSPSPVSNPSPLLSFVVSTPSAASTTPTSIGISITQSAATGTLTATNPLLTEKTGYMNVPQMLAIQAAGNEIGAHTETHPDLTTLAEATDIQEIAGSRSELLSMGASPVDTFAYPYGTYVASTKQLVNNSGFIAARTINAGYNYATGDKLALTTQIVDAATSFATVQSWIDTAAQNKQWLILVFHQIDDASTLATNGEIDGTTPQILQQIVSYLQAQQQAGNVTVKTLHAAVGLMH